MNMSLSGLCTSFSKVTLFPVPEVFCGPQICQKCVGGGSGGGALALSALETRRLDLSPHQCKMLEPGYAPARSAAVN